MGAQVWPDTGSFDGTFTVQHCEVSTDGESLAAGGVVEFPLVRSQWVSYCSDDPEGYPAAARWSAIVDGQPWFRESPVCSPPNDRRSRRLVPHGEVAQDGRSGVWRFGSDERAE